MSEYALVGHQLGPYRLLQGIGHGGMAEVYLAEDQRLGRQVAVKTLSAALALENSFRARFEREARAAAQLQHPHIVAIYDYGQQEGNTYLVMPYLANGSLADMMAKTGGPLPLGKIVPWIEGMGAALQYAHQQGIIHRDVKPGNMLLGSDEQLLLADFGIAKVIGSQTALTHTGIGVGSPEYMAPEQATGDPDHRSDIYALGVVLFQLLTGRVPFTANTPLQVMYRQVHEPPPLPHQLNPAITPVVETVVLQALAKRPDQRFQSASELALALKHAASGSAVTHIGDPWMSDATTRLTPTDGVPTSMKGSPSTHQERWPIQSPEQPRWGMAYQPGPPPAPTYESLPGAVTPESRPTPPPRGDQRFRLFLLVSLVVLIAATVGGVAVANYTHVNTSQAKQAGRPPHPGTTMASTRNPTSTLLYQEARPYCDTPQFWRPNATATPDNTICASDGLHLTRPARPNLTASLFLEYYPNEPTSGFPANYRLEVDTTLIGADANQKDDNPLYGYGIIFRNQSVNGGYFFMIDPDAGVWIFKFENGNGDVSGLGRGASSAIQTGFNEKNHLRVDVQGNQFTGYVNGVNIGTVTDASFGGGNVGLVVAFPGMTVVFANFTMAPLS